MKALIHCIENFMCFALYKVPKTQVVYRLPSPTTLRLIGNIIMLPFDFLIYIRLDICTMKIMIATRRKKHIAMAPLIIHEYSQNSVSDQKMFEFESCLPFFFKEAYEWALRLRLDIAGCIQENVHGFFFLSFAGLRCDPRTALGRLQLRSPICLHVGRTPIIRVFLIFILFFSRFIKNICRNFFFCKNVILPPVHPAEGRYRRMNRR